MLHRLTRYLEERFRTSESWRVILRVVTTVALPIALVFLTRTFDFKAILGGRGTPPEYVGLALSLSAAAIQLYLALVLFRFERKEDKDIHDLNLALQRQQEATAAAAAQARDVHLLMHFLLKPVTQQAETVLRLLRRTEPQDQVSCKSLLLDLVESEKSIQRLITQLFAFFDRPGEGAPTRVTMMVPAGNHLIFTPFFANAHNQPPRSKANSTLETQFTRAMTVAGTAWAERRLIIVEDVAKEIEKVQKGQPSVYRVLHQDHYDKIGSLFSFPIEDRDYSPDDPVIAIINVDTAMRLRFRHEHRDAIEATMREFGDRILLYLRLILLENAVREKGN